MCKVLKDYGVVADHGSKVLKLQLIKDIGEDTLSLVSYKDGMSVANRNLSKEDAAKLFVLLSTYLDYKPIVKEKTDDNPALVEYIKEEPTGILHSLTTLPSGDINYQTALKKASVDEIATAINLMEESGGRHQTRIKVCEAELAKKEKDYIPKKRGRKPKTTVETETKSEVKEEETSKEKVLVFPTEDKKPKIISLPQTNEEKTYGECVVKIQKAEEKYKEDSESIYVLEGLRELCKVDQDFRNNFMREDKTYDGFWDYMYDAARNGYCTHYEGDRTRGNLDKDKALGLAIDYFNADIEQMKAEEKKKADANKKKGASKNGKNVGKKKGRTTA